MLGRRTQPFPPKPKPPTSQGLPIDGTHLELSQLAWCGTWRPSIHPRVFWIVIVFREHVRDWVCRICPYLCLAGIGVVAVRRLLWHLATIAKRISHGHYFLPSAAGYKSEGISLSSDQSVCWKRRTYMEGTGFSACAQACRGRRTPEACVSDGVMKARVLHSSSHLQPHRRASACILPSNLRLGQP